MTTRGNIPKPWTFSLFLLRRPASFENLTTNVRRAKDTAEIADSSYVDFDFGV